VPRARGPWVDAARPIHALETLAGVVSCVAALWVRGTRDLTRDLQGSWP
jgi:hypothetical protein